MMSSILITLVSSAFFASSSSPKEGVATSMPPYVRDYNFGVQAQKEEDYERAIQLYEQAIAQKKDFSDAWNNLGFCYRMIAKLNLVKSGEAYANAVQYNPKHEQALEYQGEYFIMVGQLNNAYRNYQTLMRLKSEESDALKVNLDRVLKQAQQVLKEYKP